MKFNKITDKRPEALQDHHMPKSYDISLKAYGGGGTAKFLNPKPKKLKSPLGFNISVLPEDKTLSTEILLISANAFIPRA